MKSLTTTAAVLTVALLIAASATQAQAGEHQHVDFTTYGQDRIQCVDNHAAAHGLCNQLRSIGCESYVEHGFNHFEVHYRSFGNRRNFDCDHEAHRFENWLRSLGFATRIIHH